MVLKLEVIEQELRAQLVKGKSPPEAVATALEREKQSGSNQPTGESLTPAELANLFHAILAALPKMTLVEFARLLRPYSTSVEELASVLHQQITPPPPAQALTEALLDGGVYPETNRETMKTALMVCGYDETTVIRALQLHYPFFMDVSARLPWQNTEICVGMGEKACIEYQSGLWFISPQIPCCDANGDRRLPAHPGYTLPGSPEGGLIGRIGDHVFWIGQRGETPPGVRGTLELCPNDDLMGRYGAGLTDNSGHLSVKITLMRC